jgi:TP901 family phage tail tape measure protein
MMDKKNFGNLDLRPAVDAMKQELASAREELRHEGEDAGEAIGRGWDDGLDYTVERIKASSIKTEKAFKNLSEKIRKQVQQLSANIGGKDTKIKIDFSDIDMNSEAIRSKIEKIIKNISSEGLIEFDTKGSEQQFKNLITLYVKYQEKLNALRTNTPNLSSAGDMEANLRQQLALASELREIWSFLNTPTAIGGYSRDIKDIRVQLEAVQKLTKIKGSDGKVSEDYGELAKILKEIQGSLKVISDTFKNENNSMKSMAESGKTSFESLSQAIIEVYNNLIQVQSLVDTISQKDFNITNITQTGGGGGNMQAMKQQMAIARETMEHLRQLYDQAGETLTLLGQGGKVDLVMEFAQQLQELSLTDINKSIKGANTEMKLASVLAEMQDYIDKLTQINELRNKYNLGAWKDTFVPTQKSIVKPKVEQETPPASTAVVASIQAPTSNTEAQQIWQLKNAIDEVTNAIGRKNAGFIKEQEIVSTSVEAEKAKLRELIDVITNEIGLALDNIKVKFAQSFVVPELDKGNLQSSFDEIYNKFVELKDKIGAMQIDIGINTADITTAIQEALYAKEIAKNYRRASFSDLFAYNPYDNSGNNMISQLTGEVMSRVEAENAFYNTDYFTTNSGQLIGDIRDVIQHLAVKSVGNVEPGQENWTQVIVEAINTQGGRIVESIKLLLPKNITDSVDDSKLIHAFETLTQAINDLISNNVFDSTEEYFEDILGGGGIPDPDVQNALMTLGFMSSDGKRKFKIANVGGINAGTAIGDKFVVSTQPNASYGVPDIATLMEKQNRAYELGAAVPRIISGFEDDIGNVFQLQTRAAGVNHRSADSGMFGASPEQIDRLIFTFEKLIEVGLYPEFGGDNVMYDPEKGFTVIDLDLKDRHHDGLDDPDQMIEEFLRSARLKKGGTYDERDRFQALVRQRYALSPEQRLVNADTIAAERAQQAAQQTSGTNAKITPVMDEGAVAKVVADNVAKTPATVKVTPVVDSASNSEQAIDGESQSAADAARQFVEAANAKREFVEANKLVAQSAEASSESVKKEAEAIESIDVEVSADSPIKAETEAHRENTESIQAEIEAERELARVKDVYDGDGRPKKHEDVYRYTEDGAIVTEGIVENIDSNGAKTIITTIIKDFEAFRKEETKTEESIARVQSKLDEFIKKFRSKTGGNAQFIEGFTELSNFKIDKDNIEEALNRMTQLQARYNELEGNFRKGQASLNPFTNAITKASNIDNIFGDVEYKFNSLINKSYELSKNFERLQELSKKIKDFVAIINSSPDSITPEAFSEFSKQVGEFNLLKAQVEGAIKSERRIEADNLSDFGKLVRATKDRDYYTEKAAKEEDGSDWQRYYTDRAAEQQKIVEAIRAGLTLTEEQEAQLSAMAERHALILKDINLENAEVEEKKKKYEEIMRLLEKNHADQIALDSGSLKVIDKEAYQAKLDRERTQIDSLIQGANLDPQQTKSIEQFVKLIASLRVESSNIELMSKKWSEQNILTDEARSKIETLRQALLQVTSSSELDLWRKQWKELTNEMAMANIDAKADKGIGKLIEDERIAKVKEYIRLLKLKYDYEKKGAKEDDGSKMQSFYGEQIAKIEAKLREFDIESLANQEEKNRLLALEEAHQMAIAEIVAKKQVEKPKKQDVEEEKRLFIPQDKKIQDRYDAGYLSKGQYDDWQRQLVEYQSYMSGVAQADEATIQKRKQSLMQLYDTMIKSSNATKSFFTSGGEILPKEMWLNKGEINNMSESLMDLYGKIKTERFDDMTTSVTKLEPELGKLTFTVNDGNGNLSQYVIKVDQATGATKLFESSVKPALTTFQKFGQVLKKDFTGLFHAIIGGSGIYSFVRYIKQGIEAVKQLDIALTELKKVTDETEEAYDKFLDTAARTSSRIGSTLTNMTNATAEFAKLGYDIATAASMAESALVYTNVGDNVDVETGSQSIISTMKAFGVEANNTMSIVDKFNEVGNNFAITTKGIGDALQVSASAMAEAGNTLDETIALTTAANTIVQNPNTVGTALKTLSLRIRGVKTELEEAGLETEGMAETTSQLQAKILALTDGKVDIMADANNFKSTTQILREMSGEWENLTDVEQAAALDLLGGKRQANTLSAIISNFDIVEDAIMASENSAGSALEENAKVLDSIQGRINLFNNSVEVMWNNFLDDEVIKFIVDAGTALVKFIDKIGTLKTALFGILTYYSVFKKDKLDLAELFGIQSGKDGGYKSLIGKEGLTGSIKKWTEKKKAKKGQKKSKKDSGIVAEVLGDPEVEVKEYADELQDDIDEYVHMDISQIDDEIEHTRARLDWERSDYEDMLLDPDTSVRQSPEFVETERTIDELENKLIRLEARKKKIIDAANTPTYVEAVIGEPTEVKKTVSEYYDIFKHGLGKDAGKLSFDEGILTKELDKLKDMDNSHIVEYMQSLDDLGDTTGNTSKVLAGYAATVEDGNYTIQGASKYVEEHNAKVDASGTAAKGAAIGHAALNAAISMGISLLISGAISLITKLINKHKELAEAVEEARIAYTNAEKTLKDHRETLDDIKSDYIELADGVDSLGKNISLSASEYERYNEIVNEIAEMFPEMVSGYTEEGNAIINLRGNVEELEKAYQNEAEAAKEALKISASDTFKNFKNNTTKDGFLSSQSKSDELTFFKGLINNKGSDISDWIEDYMGEGVMPSTVTIDTWLESAGIKNTNWFSGLEGLQQAIDDNYEQILARYSQLKKEVESEANALTPILKLHLEESLDYSKLSDKGKEMAQAIIAGFDTEFYANDEFKEWSDITKWIDENVTQKLQDENLMLEFDASLSAQTKFNNGDMHVGQYMSYIDTLIDVLGQFGVDEEIIKSVKVVFDFDDYKAKIESAKEILDSAGDESVGWLTKDQLDTLDKNKAEWKEELKADGKTEMSWDDLINKIAEAQVAARDFAAEWKKASEKIDGIQDAYSTLTDVVEDYNSNGYLTLDNLQALLSLEPEYLAVLQMEDGQLRINQQAMEALLQTQLAKAEATVVDTAITQLNALSEEAKMQAVENSATAMENAIPTLGAYASELSKVGQEALIASGKLSVLAEATNGAIAAGVDPEKIQAVFSGMDAQLAAIDSVRTNLPTNFNSIVSPDSSDSSDEDDRLTKLQEKYERKISNLDNQQTYLENEIERLEAENKGISKSYYEEQIALEEQKMALLQQEREELTSLLNSTAEGSDEWSSNWYKH